MTLKQQVVLSNCLLVHSQFTNTIPKGLSNTFVLVQNLHNYNTRLADQGLVKPTVHTTKYGVQSIKSQCVKHWNDLTNAIIIIITLFKFG